MTEIYSKYLKYLRDSMDEGSLEILDGYLEEVGKSLKKLGDVDDEFVYNVVDMIEALIESIDNGSAEQQIVDDDDVVELEEGEKIAKETKEEQVDILEIIEKDFSAIKLYIEDGELYNPINKYQERGYMLIKKEEETYKMGIKGTRGITVCGVCKMDNIIMHFVQKRGLDEGESVFNTCADCNHKWFVA